MSVYERKRVLVTIKTYPTPASKGAEVSCTAGVTDDGKWIRLFPIPFRYMGGDKQFKKYQWIEVDAKKSSDPRQESFEVNIDTLKVVTDALPSKNAWQARKDIIFPLKAPSLCYLQKSRKQTGVTLGIFKPKSIHKFIIEPENLKRVNLEEKAVDKAAESGQDILLQINPKEIVTLKSRFPPVNIQPPQRDASTC